MEASSRLGDGFEIEPIAPPKREWRQLTGGGRCIRAAGSAPDHAELHSHDVMVLSSVSENNGAHLAGNGVIPTAMVANSTLTATITAVRAARAMLRRLEDRV